MIIVYQARFETQIHNLIDVLFFNGYFGFEENAIEYAHKIYDFIENNIERKLAGKSPIRFQHYGHNYIKYKANSHTTWYIFFDQKGDRFIINYILNNHSQEYPDFSSCTQHIF